MKFRFLSIFFICVLTVLSYFPVLGHDIVNWDDDIFLTKNPLVSDFSFRGIQYLFLNAVEGRYYPLTMISLGLDALLFGPNPIIFHLVNVILHAINVVLVYVLLTHLKIGDQIALLATLLFAIHPLQVESVAWIAARKDLLATTFALLAIICLTGREACLSSVQMRRCLYGFAILAYVGSLLSKPMAVTLPIVFLIFFRYKSHSTLSQALRLSTPFFLMAVISSWVTIHAANQVWPDIPGIGVLDKIILSGYALAMYVVKLVIPIGQSHYYPIQSIFPLSASTIWEMLVVVCCGLGVLMWIFYRVQQPLVKYGFGFFILMMAPVLHLIKVNASIIYERFLYLPSLGLFIVMAVLMVELYRRMDIRVIRLIVVAVFSFGVLCLSVRTWQRSLVWRDSHTLWSDAIQKYPANDFVYLKRANALVRQREFVSAIADLKRSLMLNPNNPFAHFNLAQVYSKIAREDLALPHLEKAIRINPDYQKAIQQRHRILKTRKANNP